MKQTDILQEVQKKLIGDLDTVVRQVKSDYREKIHNTWVFDYVDNLIEKLQSGKVESVTYTRNELENKLQKTATRMISPLQKYVPEIKTEDINYIITVAGNINDLINSRSEKELFALATKSSDYATAEELVNSEFHISRAFNFRYEHEAWLSKFSTNLTEIFSYLEDTGRILTEKKGIKWKIKLGSAKFILKQGYGVDLNLPEMASDVSLAKEAIITSYQAYETELIQSRYSESKYSSHSLLSREHKCKPY